MDRPLDDLAREEAVEELTVTCEAGLIEGRVDEGASERSAFQWRKAPELDKHTRVSLRMQEREVAARWMADPRQMRIYTVVTLGCFGLWLAMFPLTMLHLVPISGYAGGLDAVKFLLMPIGLSLLARLGTEARLYRAMFLEEVGKDYVRTARAKGLSEAVVLFRHVLKNALIPIITSAGSYLPYVFLGSLVFESFFGIPGLGAFVIEAISGEDFAIVRTMVFLGALLYIASNALIDIAYTWVDPRVRLS